MQSPRRRRKKRARRDEVIVASNGCRCGDCLECRLAKLRRLGETHRKGGRGPHHWNGMAPILEYAGKLAARYGGTTEEVVEMLSQGRTEEDMRILWEGVESADPSPAAAPREPAPPARVAAVERALRAAKAERAPILPGSMRTTEIASRVGHHRATVARYLADRGVDARRRPIPISVLASRCPELLAMLQDGAWCGVTSRLLSMRAGTRLPLCCKMDQRVAERRASLSSSPPSR